MPDLQGVDLEVAEPQLFFDTGIWHPLAPCKPSAQRCGALPAMLWLRAALPCCHGAMRPAAGPG